MTDITESITQLRAWVLTVPDTNGDADSVRNALFGVADTPTISCRKILQMCVEGYAKGLGEIHAEIDLITNKVIPKILQDASYACEYCDSKRDCCSPASCPSSGYSKWSWVGADIN
mgnify:CR=1 FL=1